MADHGWTTIDASYMAVEEVAREVMRRRGLPERSLG
jgi:regulator of PEP synthase PpsR (kinase-PPPase family)